MRCPSMCLVRRLLVLAVGVLGACGADASAVDDAVDVAVEADTAAVDTATGVDTDTDTVVAADTADTTPSADSDAEVDSAGPDATSATIAAAFPPGAFFFTDVSATPKAADSDAVIGALRAAGGWGNGDLFQIDFSLDLLVAGPDTEKRAFVATDDFYSPDCDPAPVPLPAGGNLEGEDGYACESDGDCHLLVWAPDEARLYEMWRANVASDTFYGGCLAIWELDRVYPETGRGDQCTSADAAGFPIAPLTFTADEVAGGEIRHAIRFVLPNDRVRRRTYVRPATHGTNTTGGDLAPPYGVHLRLRADYPVESLPSEGARVVARALKRYGMYHADGGQIALTALSDRHTEAKWAGLLGPHDLGALDVEDFEVIAHSDPIALTYDCVREPLTE